MSNWGICAAQSPLTIVLKRVEWNRTEQCRTLIPDDNQIIEYSKEMKGLLLCNSIVLSFTN